MPIPMAMAMSLPLLMKEICGFPISSNLGMVNNFLVSCKFRKAAVNLPFYKGDDFNKSW